MKDYTLQETKITSDFQKSVFKNFRKVRYGIEASTKKDIPYDLALIRKELLTWQLLPGTDRSLLADISIYPTKGVMKDCPYELPAGPAPTTAIIPPLDIREIIDELPDFI